MDRPDSFRIDPSGYRRITIAAAVALAIIVVSGAAVRLTGSGLGCTDWPNCTDGQLVAPLEFHAMVEFVNRLFTGVVSIAVIAAVLGAYRRDPYRRDLTLWSWGLVAGVVAQIVWGGFTVLSDLHPTVVAGHFLISMVLMWNAVVLSYRASRPDDSLGDPPIRDLSSRLATAAAVWGAAALLTGPAITGTGPHAGDEQARRFAWNLTTVARVHSVAMWILLALIVATAAVVARERGGGPPLTAVRAALIATVIQGGIGYVQYATEVPPLLVAIHVAGATIVWCLVVLVALASRHPNVGSGSVATGGLRPEKVRA